MEARIKLMQNKAKGQLHMSGLTGLLHRAMQDDFVIPLMNKDGDVYVLIDHTIGMETKDYELYTELGKALYNDINL